MQKARPLQRDDSRMIIHFDYDCFYASVVENENPALKAVPLAIQQKQIVVTCNYEARRKGLHKLQLITDAKRICPEAVIVLGEDLTRFRNASKDLYAFLSQSIWSNRAERLGFDEVWLDCTDMIDYNIQLLNHNNLQDSFFCLDKNDPTVGFQYDALSVFGPQYPKLSTMHNQTHLLLGEEDLHIRLRLVVTSHLARHLRHELERQKGYTATVGIATNKVLSKLVGNLNKPRSQTTLVPPYENSLENEGTATQFIDTHDIGKIPGVGFKLAQKIRSHVLGHAAGFHDGLVFGQTKESVTSRDVRLSPNMGPELLEEILSGPGSHKGVGGKIWALLHGIDDTEVGKIKRVPSQISQEDSYMKYLYTFDQVRRQLFLLTERLLRRMQLDLTEDDDLGDNHSRRWLAHPRTLRLTTRPRPAPNSDGSRTRTFNRISRSAPMPTLAFNLNEDPPVIAEKLVVEALIPMFRALHPQFQGWNLSLINIAVTNMAETAADSKDSEGRDIGRMFQRQDEVLKDFRIVDEGSGRDASDIVSVPRPEFGSEVDGSPPKQLSPDEEGLEWESEESGQEVHVCHRCSAAVPPFARDAHERYHIMSD